MLVGCAWTSKRVETKSTRILAWCLLESSQAGSEFPVCCESKHPGQACLNAFRAQHCCAHSLSRQERLGRMSTSSCRREALQNLLNDICVGRVQQNALRLLPSSRGKSQQEQNLGSCKSHITPVCLHPASALAERFVCILVRTGQRHHPRLRRAVQPCKKYWPRKQVPARASSTFVRSESNPLQLREQRFNRCRREVAQAIFD